MNNDYPPYSQQPGPSPIHTPPIGYAPPFGAPGHGPDLRSDMMVNNSGDRGMPPLAVLEMGWNWGAFLADWLWAFANRLWLWGILCFGLWIAVNVLNFKLVHTIDQTTGVDNSTSMNTYGLWFILSICVYMMVRCYLAANAYKLAWRHRRFSLGIDQFRDVQRKWSIAGIVLFLLNFGLVALGRTSIGFLAIWRPYHSADGHFTVDVPTTPEVETSTLTVPQTNITFPMTSVTCELTKTTFYVVMYMIIPASPTSPSDIHAALDNSIDVEAKRLDGARFNVVYHTVQGYPAVDYTIYGLTSHLTSNNRTILVGNRVYEVMAVSGSPYFDNHARFINTFTLDSDIPPAEQPDDDSQSQSDTSGNSSSGEVQYAPAPSASTPSYVPNDGGTQPPDQANNAPQPSSDQSGNQPTPANPQPGQPADNDAAPTPAGPDQSNGAPPPDQSNSLPPADNVPAPENVPPPENVPAPVPMGNGGPPSESQPAQ